MSLLIVTLFIISGTAIAAQIRNELKSSIQDLQTDFGITPGLTVVLVGDRRDSATYVRSKKKACADLGINSVGVDYPVDVTQEELLAKIDELNNGTNVCRSNLSF
jgi:5,10-methylene-tetrahydrofolate dehydrogenase/methenyl tetrahydrofolate cyclohydrolase